ncbi:MAG: hypothetical protein CMI23_05780 [Opitutae bacterium]|nr:hypothetical protein [Opitutae bacterium]|tara:strand:+ start:366 stop:1154 length:789 start_codon:yes stop_codon:yes gene_type:complete
MFKSFLKKVPGAKALNMYLLEKRIQSNFLTLNNVDTKQVKFYSQFIKKNDLVFDVGANIGSRSKIFINIGANVKAFEPQPELVKFLTQHIGKHPKFELINIALGEKIKTSKLKISDAHVLSSMCDRWIESTQKSGRFSNYKWNKSIDVQVNTLDNMISRYGSPEFTKIDVEGYEFEVLNGLSQPIKTISFEFTSEEKKQAFACLERLNKIADYRFKFSEGEKMEFNNEEWLPKFEFCEFINSYTEKSKLLWGDIYATISMKV